MEDQRRLLPLIGAKNFDLSGSLAGYLITQDAGAVAPTVPKRQPSRVDAVRRRRASARRGCRPSSISGHSRRSSAPDAASSRNEPVRYLLRLPRTGKKRTR